MRQHGASSYLQPVRPDQRCYRAGSASPSRAVVRTRVGHRSGLRLHFLAAPATTRRRHHRRPGRKRLHRRHHAVADFQDDRGRVQADRRHQQLLGRLRDQAECSGHRPRVFHVPRRSNFDLGRAIAIDTAGNAYITGQTKSSNFPTTGGRVRSHVQRRYLPRCGIDQYDAFVAKLNPTGSSLVYSSFLGGFDIDDGLGIAVDRPATPTSRARPARSTSRPVPAHSTRRGTASPTCSSRSSIPPAPHSSTRRSSAARSSTGLRASRSRPAETRRRGLDQVHRFPTTAGAFDRTANGEFDAFVTRLNARPFGARLLHFPRRSGFDSASGYRRRDGSAYVAGGTGSLVPLDSRCVRRGARRPRCIPEPVRSRRLGA